MGNRVTVEHGDNLARRIELRQGLQLTRGLSRSRWEPVGERQHADVAASGLLNHRLDYWPGRIANAIDDDVNLVVGIVLLQQTSYRGCQKRIEAANAQDSRRARALAVRQRAGRLKRQRKIT